MPLTILTNSQTKSLLFTLSRDDIVNLQRNLSEALREYSTGNQEGGCCAAYQQQRTTITRKDGSKTVFMPARTGDSYGLKIVTVREETGELGSKRGNEQEGGHAGEERAGLSRPPSTAASTTTSTLESSDTQSTTSALSGLTLSPTATAPDEVIPPACDASVEASLTLLDSAGAPTGVLNAAEVTAFRTALTALLTFDRRSNVKTITVFGAGKQAYWHIRLALLLRGSDIKRVNIVNRSFERISNLLREFYSSEQSSWRSDVKFSALSPDFVDYDRLLKESVRKADVIFCCTSSPEPLFPAKFLTSDNGRKKGRFISAVGSCNAQMAELHPGILQDAVAESHGHNHRRVSIHRRPRPRRGGVIVVDCLESCLKEAGEVVQAGLTPQQMVEVGELLTVKQAAKQQIEQGGEDEKGLQEWMERGNVIYKSIGMGLMDLVVGRDLIRLVVERSLGTTIEDF